jgi:hypothetical protein
VSFTLDSNILIGLIRTYPRDIFGSLWDSIESAVDEEGVCICEAVLREVHRGGDELHSWAQGVAGFVCRVTDGELATVASIAAEHPDWVRAQVNEADPFVIAHAKAEGSVVVTEENLKGPGTLDKNLKIPNVASEHGVQCIKFFQFVRAHGWSF